MSQVSLGRPEFVLGTPPGHPDRQIPFCDFSLSVFFLSIFKGVFKQGPFAYTNGRFASSFLLLGMGLYKPRKRQICLSRVPLRNPI